MRMRALLSLLSVAAIATSGMGAEPLGPASDPGVVLSNGTLWRQFYISGASHVRTVEGELVRANITSKMARSGDIKVNISKHAPALYSPRPPADWTSAAMDDSAWPRVRFPQPVLTSRAGYDMRVRMFHPYSTVVVLARGKFLVKDPAAGEVLQPFAGLLGRREGLCQW